MPTPTTVPIPRSTARPNTDPKSGLSTIPTVSVIQYERSSGTSKATTSAKAVVRRVHRLREVMPRYPRGRFVCRGKHCGQLDVDLRDGAALGTRAADRPRGQRDHEAPERAEAEVAEEEFDAATGRVLAGAQHAEHEHLQPGNGRVAARGADQRRHGGNQDHRRDRKRRTETGGEPDEVAHSRRERRAEEPSR